MYKLGDIFYLDDEYSARAEFCNQNGLRIVEIESDVNGRRFQIQEWEQPTEHEIAQQEINKLKQWFDYEYSYKEQKYRRLIALNLLDDDGISPEDKLNKLYEDAELNRVKIQELEKIV